MMKNFLCYLAALKRFLQKLNSLLRLSNDVLEVIEKNFGRKSLIAQTKRKQMRESSLEIIINLISIPCLHAVGAGKSQVLTSQTPPLRGRVRMYRILYRRQHNAGKTAQFIAIVLKGK